MISLSPCFSSRITDHTISDCFTSYTPVARVYCDSRSSCISSNYDYDDDDNISSRITRLVSKRDDDGGSSRPDPAV